MKRRRIIRTLGATAGGLLGAAFAPAAFAFADNYGPYDLTPDPNSVDMVEAGGIRNFLQEVPPAAQGSVQGYQTFDVTDPTTHVLAGTIGTDVTNVTDTFGNTNQILVVTGDGVPGTVGTQPGDLPPIGSVFDTYTYSSGLQTVYSDIPGAGPGGQDLITYEWVNSHNGHITNIGTNFDAIKSTEPVNVSLGSDHFTVSGLENVGGINGISPADFDVLGTQAFTTTDGTFTADIANSADVAGNSTQDMLVTQSTDPNVPVGSVIDYFFSGNGSYNVYSDIPQTNGTDKIVDQSINSHGHVTNIPTNFDAAAGLDKVLDGQASLAGPIDLPNAYDITPATTGTIVAIDGIQPEDIDIQGYQQFDYTTSSGTSVFDADVSRSFIIGNTTQEQLVVTQDVSGNAPPVGSVFNVAESSNGAEKIYSDIPGAGTGGKDLITYTYVGPHGGEIHLHNSYDASLYLHGDQFLQGDVGAPLPAGADVFDPTGHGGLAADLISMLDPSSAASSIDPAMIDPTPHVDGLLNLLGGLF